MTEQAITVTKIEPNPNNPGWWRVHCDGSEKLILTTKQVRAMGLTLPQPSLTVTIGEHTATINRDDAEAFSRWLAGDGAMLPGHGEAAVALADLIRTALQDDTDLLADPKAGLPLETRFQ